MPNYYGGVIITPSYVEIVPVAPTAVHCDTALAERGVKRMAITKAA